MGCGLSQNTRQQKKHNRTPQNEAKLSNLRRYQQHILNVRFNQDNLTEDSSEDTGQQERIKRDYLEVGQSTDIFPLQSNIQHVYDTLGIFAEVSDLETNPDNYKKIVFNDGSIFFGQINEFGIRQGIGRQLWKNHGNFIEGVWNNDKLNGPVRVIYQNGDYFEGTMVNNKIEGFAIFHSKDKVIEGMWSNNYINGKGKEKRSNGILYEGSYEKGIIEGHGTFYYPDGRTYNGEVNKGCINGYGTIKFKNGSQFKGNLIFNEIKGFGTFTDSEGKTTEGYVIKTKYKYQLVQ